MPHGDRVAPRKGTGDGQLGRGRARLTAGGAPAHGVAVAPGRVEAVSVDRRPGDALVARLRLLLGETGGHPGLRGRLGSLHDPHVAGLVAGLEGDDLVARAGLLEGRHDEGDAGLVLRLPRQRLRLIEALGVDLPLLEVEDDPRVADRGDVRGPPAEAEVASLGRPEAVALGGDLHDRARLRGHRHDVPVDVDRHRRIGPDGGELTGVHEVRDRGAPLRVEALGPDPPGVVVDDGQGVAAETDEVGLGVVDTRDVGGLRQLHLALERLAGPRVDADETAVARHGDDVAAVLEDVRRRLSLRARDGLATPDDEVETVGAGVDPTPVAGAAARDPDPAVGEGDVVDRLTVGTHGEDPEHHDEHRDHGPRDGGEPDGPTTARGLGGPLGRPLPLHAHPPVSPPRRSRRRGAPGRLRSPCGSTARARRAVTCGCWRACPGHRGDRGCPRRRASGRRCRACG